ncbi:MAG: phosphate ABC transporter ATP-binding protein [Propionibacteriaceae bacterium]|jgi:phosphate transport system ATP-binding protein|nr:phosphate ABC transporter ATP-binding protein [Propionibacteriaceae bacterium]
MTQTILPTIHRETTTPIPAPISSDGPKIAITNFSAYYGSFLAISNVNVTIEPKQVTAFIGPSGCGKTTLLRSINRLHEVTPGARTEGSVRLGATDLYDPRVDVAAVRARIGMVFQRPNPFPTMSIRDNVLAGPRLQGRRLSRSEADDLVESSLRAAGLWEDAKDRLRAAGAGLSGGQQQRLCIARAVANSPDVILMDEPCSSLDPISTATIEAMIVDLARNYTVIIVTHNMQQALRVSRRTAFFSTDGASRPGRLVEYGDTMQVFNAPREEATARYVGGHFG